jgi:CheY-like chemotaxis protein
MAITQNLIRLMGGEIDIHSKPNKGTVTTVRLPQQAVGAGIIGEALAKDLQAFCNVKPSKRKQIVIKPMPHVHALVVDDVETNLYTTKGLLATYEIKVSVARNGNEAIQLVKQGNQYDIIFMDHMMPKPDGIETTQILRKMLYTKPIVALTANAVLGQAEMFLQNGFDAYLSKPIDLTRLNHILHTLVKNQKETVKTSPPKAKPAAEVSPKKAMIFVSDAKRAIPYLENVYDLENYVIHAHAMKSALRDVHEMELSAFALILEKAGKKREISFIKTETPAFINKLRKVVEALSPAKS